MSHVIMLIPTDINVGLTSVSLGIVHIMERKNISVSFFKPISQNNIHDCIGIDKDKDLTIQLLRSHSNIHIAEPLKINYVKSLLINGYKDLLMDEIVARYHDNHHQAKVVLIEGLTTNTNNDHSYSLFAKSLNYYIASTLSADIVLVTVIDNNAPEKLKEYINLVNIEFSNINKNNNIVGVIINKLNAPSYKYNYHIQDLPELLDLSNEFSKISPIISNTKFNLKKIADISPVPILGCIPWNINLMAPRGIDLAKYLNAIIINQGRLNNLRIKSVFYCNSTIPVAGLRLFTQDSLIVIHANCTDIILSAYLAAISGNEIGTLLLIGGSYNVNNYDDDHEDLRNRAFKTGLPVLIVKTNTWKTFLQLQSFSFKIYDDDFERIENMKNYISSNINIKWINSLGTKIKPSTIQSSSPHAFRYQLTELARKANKLIVLPEGNEPRTIKAAALCAERGIAKCILLGDPDQIKLVAVEQGIKLGLEISIINPKLVRKNYVNRLVELRKNKGMNEILAYKQLQDNIMLGTMMLEKNEVDGLVAGAVHTTANTIRPSLQIIKTAPGSSLVSSIFFMLLPDQVLIFGDCAINPEPTAKELSEIAIQSANSAKIFGIEPRIAMISYATGDSSSSSAVEKVREATKLAQAKQPNLLIDGPLQYDAAIIADVAKSKAPNSPVAGRANIFIFPDLNTGNTTYKAVQRSANIISIGPMLQGMRKSINDLSRGALVEDIVYTIALTAIQAQATQNKH